MLVPIFTLKLNQKVFPRLVTVGTYDGKHSCLTGATNGGKVFLHTPHQRTKLTSSGKVGGADSVGRLSLASQESDIVRFSFGQHITAIGAGRLSPDLNRDILVIGSQTNILAYDVEKNSELFYKDLPDGANNIVIGHLGSYKEPLALVGGNCAIKGFDSAGEDVYWTVTGDNVCSMALLDFTSNKKNELLVGSEDYEIRVFEDDELLMEMSEADVVSSLCSIQGSRFAYSLINGMVGMYNEYHRQWRTKSKSHPMCIHAYDINEDGVPELVTGWASGRVDIRSIEDGSILYKDTFGSAIAGIVQADYRMDGKEELMCCSLDGEVRGYLPPSQSESVHEASVPLEQSAVEQLYQRKQELMLELKNFEVASRHSDSSSARLLGEPLQSIPASTLIKTDFKTTSLDDGKATPGIQLTVEASNNAILRTVAVFADGLFEGESLIIHPPASKISNVISVPIYPEKDIPSELQIKAYVGSPSSSQLHVFEAVRLLPRFSLYVPCGLDISPSPQGSVVFNLPERLDRVLDWFKKNFLYGLGENAVLSPNLQVAYMSLRTRTPLIITVEPSNHGMTTIRTDDMDLVGDLVAALASHFSIEDLSVTADFPHQLKDLKLVLSQVEELQKTRQQLTTEMADNSSVIGNLVVRAEDARMMNHMGNMRKAYNQLYQLNRDLMMGYKIRSNNHMQLLECLKIVNQAIQRAGRLRVGRSKTKVIAACRSGLKSRDHEALFKAIRYGAS